MKGMVAIIGNIEHRPTVIDTAMASGAETPSLPNKNTAANSLTPHPLTVMGRLAAKLMTAEAARSESNGRSGEKD